SLLFVGKLLLRVRRRHPLALVGGENASDERTSFQIARDDGDGVGFEPLEGFVALVEPQAGLSLLRIRTVAGKALVGQDRTDITAIVELVVGNCARQKRDRDCATEKIAQATHRLAPENTCPLS